MDLVPIDATTLPIGRPLPCDLFTDSGTLLARRGHVFDSVAQRNELCDRGVRPYIPRSESVQHQAAFLREVSPLLGRDAPLSQLVELADARAHATPSQRVSDAPVRPSDIRGVDWLGLQQRLDVTLKSPSPDTFVRRISDIGNELQHAFALHQDATLAVLTYLGTRETKRYCAAHALQVGLISFVAAREVLAWDPNECKILLHAALSMNIAMAALQDTMAEQRAAPTDHQIDLIQRHAKASVEVLGQLGIRSDLWLQVVASHHDNIVGPLAGRAAHERLARLLRRADILCAKMSRRSSRKSMRTLDAMRSIYVDEMNQPKDEAGAALVRTLGLHPPGTLVRLGTEETAIVLGRPTKLQPSPPVGVILTKDGMPTSSLTHRNTNVASAQIKSSVPSDDINVQLPLHALVDAVQRAGRH